MARNINIQRLDAVPAGTAHRMRLGLPTGQTPLLRHALQMPVQPIDRPALVIVPGRGDGAIAQSALDLARSRPPIGSDVLGRLAGLPAPVRLSACTLEAHVLLEYWKAPGPATSGGASACHGVQCLGWNAATAACACRRSSAFDGGLAPL